MVRPAAWFSASEAAAWGPLLSTVMWLPSALDIQLEGDAGLNSFEFGVLASLSMHENHAMRLSELARPANSGLSRLSKVVDRLATRGWVERRPDPKDKRSTLAVLTQEGMAKFSAAAPGHVARVRELVFDHLTPEEFVQLAVISSKIAQATGLDGACATRRG